MIPMLSGVVEFFVRVGVALLLPKLIGQNGIFYAEIAAWTGAADFADDQLLYQHSQICLMHENLL